MWKMQVQSLGWDNPVEKEMQLTPVFLPEKSHGWRSLVGYGLWSLSILPSITSLVANLHALEHTVMYHQDLKRIAENFNSGYRKPMVNHREE